MSDEAKQNHSKSKNQKNHSSDKLMRLIRQRIWKNCLNYDEND
ncbi:MAG: hypothetical protein JWQ63_2591 [Mucilaginibacter sp.]|jgi:hypothetical protein|nr:hypothetical protein [Mucilaginibacter sp.]